MNNLAWNIRLGELDALIEEEEDVIQKLFLIQERIELSDRVLSTDE